MENETGVLAGGRLEELFRVYFNNKMTLLLMMIEHPEISRKALSVERQRIFLHDLYPHSLQPKHESKYRRAFEWPFRFLDLYPDVRPHKIYQALRMANLIYEVFGLELPKRTEAERLEREGMERSKER